MSGHLRGNVSQNRPWTFKNNEMRWEGILCSLIEYVSKSLNFTYSLNEETFGPKSETTEFSFKNNVINFPILPRYKIFKNSVFLSRRQI